MATNRAQESAVSSAMNNLQPAKATATCPIESGEPDEPLVPKCIEHAIASITKSRHDELVIIQYGIDGRYKNFDLRKLMLKLLDPLLGC